MKKHYLVPTYEKSKKESLALEVFSEIFGDPSTGMLYEEFVKNICERELKDIFKKSSLIKLENLNKRNFLVLLRNFLSFYLLISPVPLQSSHFNNRSSKNCISIIFRPLPSQSGH